MRGSGGVKGVAFRAAGLLVATDPSFPGCMGVYI